jgi:hypothetical protein
MKFPTSILKVAATLLLSFTTAHAGPDDPEWNPPARYDHAYSGKLVLRKIPQEQLRAACDNLFIRNHLTIRATTGMRGCSFRKGGRCEVLTIDRTYRRATPQAALRHELGHCNGWPANHPN